MKPVNNANQYRTSSPPRSASKEQAATGASARITLQHQRCTAEGPAGGIPLTTVARQENKDTISTTTVPGLWQRYTAELSYYPRRSVLKGLSLVPGRPETLEFRAVKGV